MIKLIYNPIIIIIDFIFFFLLAMVLYIGIMNRYRLDLFFWYHWTSSKSPSQRNRLDDGV